MSVPIHCPECDDLITETGWGDDLGKFNCQNCQLTFERYKNEAGGVSTRILD